MKRVPVTFKFDPFATVIACFTRMFPKKSASIDWDERLHKEECAWGKTDLIHSAIPSIAIDSSQSVASAVDTLIHELAHVGRGHPANRLKNLKKFVDNDGHDSKWEDIYSSLWREYEKYQLTNLFLSRIGQPKMLSDTELHKLISAFVDASYYKGQKKSNPKRKPKS